MACTRSDQPRKVNLDKRDPVSATGNDKIRHLRVSVGGMITPKAGLAYYRQLLDHIEEKLGIRVDLVDRENYAAINDMLKDGTLDAAFVCGGPYVEGHRDFGLELLVAPQAYGDSVYYAYIIVNKDSKIMRLEELRGMSFAFTDPLSNTGKLVPEFMLKQQFNTTPNVFFSKQIYTAGHDKSIKAVAQGIVTGASVDSLIWEYLNRTDNQYTSKTRIIAKSPPYGIPPFVVSKNLDQKTKEKLRHIFLDLHNDSKGSILLRRMMIDKFIEIDNSAYDSIRQMKNFVEGQQRPGKTAK